MLTAIDLAWPRGSGRRFLKSREDSFTPAEGNRISVVLLRPLSDAADTSNVPDALGRNDHDPPAIIVISGDPMNGTDAADFLLVAGAASGSSDAINGLAGDDFIVGEMQAVGFDTNLNNSFANAVNLDFGAQTGIWSTDENPLFGDDAIPHLTILVLPVGGDQEYFKITIGAGQTLTIDIDGGGGTLGNGSDTDTNVVLYAASDLVNSVASNNDSAITAGGYGSVSTRDSFLTYTNTGATQVFYIRILEFLGNFNLEADDLFLLKVSLTGAQTVAPQADNADDVNAGDGDDHLFGVGGNDILNGGNGADLMVGGTGDDTYLVGNPGDLVVEDVNEGVDSVTTAISYTLTANVEILEASAGAGESRSRATAWAIRSRAITPTTRCTARAATIY